MGTMARNERGLYEVLVTEALEEELRNLGDELEARRNNLRAAEAADRVALQRPRMPIALPSSPPAVAHP